MRLFCLRFSLDWDGLRLDEDMAASVRPGTGMMRGRRTGRVAESSRGIRVIASQVTFI
jgi:hypothetical protein